MKTLVSCNRLATSAAFPWWCCHLLKSTALSLSSVVLQVNSSLSFIFVFLRVYQAFPASAVECPFFGMLQEANRTLSCSDCFAKFVQLDVVHLIVNTLGTPSGFKSLMMNLSRHLLLQFINFCISVTRSPSLSMSSCGAPCETRPRTVSCQQLPAAPWKNLLLLVLLLMTNNFEKNKWCKSWCWRSLVNSHFSALRSLVQ